MKERPAGRSCLSAQCAQAALSHIDVSKALLINGMFVPKLAFAACLLAPFAACLTATFWATSVARSHDPFSWERATEKNKNT
jgi:hypothetical protein